MKKLQILGMGCSKCQLLTAHAEAAAKELGIDYEIEKITDVGTIIDMGAMMTPALAIDNTVVLSGTTSSHGEIKKILQALT